MLLVALDCETWLIEDGGGAPPVVCFGWCVVEEEPLGKPLPVASGDPPWVVRNPTYREGMITHRGEQDPTRDTLPVSSMSEAVRHLLRLVMAKPPAEARLINQYPAFDFAVLAQHDPSLLPLIFEAYEGGWIECTKLREQLLDLADGHMGYHVGPDGKRSKKSYTLAGLVQNRFHVDLDKTTWRLGYKDLHDVPLAQWPDGARKYVVDDVTWAIEVWCQQARDAEDAPVPGTVPNAGAQARADFALQLLSWWGIRTDRREVQKYKARLQVALKLFTSALQRAGLIRTEGVQSKNMAAIRAVMVQEAAKVKGFNLAMTDGGTTGQPQVSTSDEAISDLVGELMEVPSTMKAAEDLAQAIISGTLSSPVSALSLVPWHTTTQKMLNTYVSVLEEGQDRPIMARYEVLKDNGRTSASKNMQTLPKERGPRDCHVARQNHILCSVDYTGLELHTLSQVCIWKVGYSRLGEALNTDIDPHTQVMVPFMGGLTYDDAVAARKYRGDDLAKLALKKKVTKLRNYGKILNFGLGGGMGALRLRAHFKKNGVLITLEEAQQYRDAWFQAWTEMREYHRIIGAELTDLDDKGREVGVIEQFGSGRVRGGSRFTEMANGYFSALANDGAKESLFQIQKESYTPGGRLWGSRSAIFLHDEIIMEHPYGPSPEERRDTHRRAFLQAEIMCQTMQKFVPDVRIKALPALMVHWHKDAEDVYEEIAGEKILAPWSPSEGP